MAEALGMIETRSFPAMVEAADRGESIGDGIMFRSWEKAQQALELLVAQARIDGEISKEERDAFYAEATSGDYDHLLATATEWFEIE